MHQSFPFAFFLIVIFSLCFDLDAHFTINSPVASRELQALPNSNEHFWPISGGNTLRTIKNCLLFPKGPVATASPGQTLTLGYLIGNGASHVGMCTAELYNCDTNQKVQDLGSQNNCISSNRAMQVTLPSMNCDHCVIRIQVLATHIPWAPEHYDSCMDIQIKGDLTYSNPYTYPHLANPYSSNDSSSTASSSVPTPLSPSSSSSSSSGPSSESSSSSSYNGSQDPSSSSSSSTCTNGQYRCSSQDNLFWQCVYGTWLKRPLAEGTMCKLDAQGMLQILNQDGA